MSRQPPSRARDYDSPDPFASWPQAVSAEVIEDVPAEGASVEHVRGEVDVPDGYTLVEGSPLGERRSVAVVVSRFNGGVTNRLLQRALEALEAAGVAQDAITVVPVPGAFELPLAAMALAKTRRYACIVALGTIVRGETPHFEYVASRVRVRPAARRDRDRDPRRLRRAHGRERRAGGGADRQGGRRPCSRRSRWPTSSPGSARPPRLGPPERLRYNPPPMSKVCAICGKKPAFGNNRSHSMVATKRRFDPNLQRVRVLLNGTAKRAYVCTRCLKGGKVTKAI